jgi:hypothetical protein
MFRNRNLDIAIAALISIAGGFAALENMPGPITIPLGIGLFLAPGYLWSQVILSQRMIGFERVMVAAGMALIVPILGGFVLSVLHIPLFKKDWVGMLVVLALFGALAAGLQRLRGLPEDQEEPAREQSPRRSSSAVFGNTFVYGLAAVIGLGAIAYSVNDAENQQFPGYTMFSMTPVVNNPLAQNMAELSNNSGAQFQAAGEQDALIGDATQGHLYVKDEMGVPETYKVVVTRQGKTAGQYTFSLNNGQSWTKTIAYTTRNNYEMLANIYVIPNTTTPYTYLNNGVCAGKLSLLPEVLQSEDPCFASVKTPAPAKRTAK